MHKRDNKRSKMNKDASLTIENEVLEGLLQISLSNEEGTIHTTVVQDNLDILTLSEVKIESREMRYRDMRHRDDETERDYDQR